MLFKRKKYLAYRTWIIEFNRIHLNTKFDNICHYCKYDKFFLCTQIELTSIRLVQICSKINLSLNYIYTYIISDYYDKKEI
jgi:hypothetical protein